MDSISTDSLVKCIDCNAYHTISGQPECPNCGSIYSWEIVVNQVPPRLHRVYRDCLVCKWDERVGKCFNCGMEKRDFLMDKLKRSRMCF